MSIYSSSVKTIIRTRYRQLTASLASAPALVVAMEHTPGFSDLPCVTAEVLEFRELWESMGLNLVEPKRPKENVIPYLL